MAQQANYAVFDLETTGLKPAIHGVCEVAIMIIDSVTLEELGRYESVIASYDTIRYHEDGTKTFEPYEIDNYALTVNGLTREKIDAGKPAKEVVAEMIAFCKKHMAGSKKHIPVGHNINKFDLPHFDNLFDSVKKDLSKIFSSMYSVDTQLESHRIFAHCTGTGEHTLARLCERFNVDKFDAHSAMPDVIANAGVFVKIQKRMRGEGTTEVAAEDKIRPRVEFNF